MERGSDQAAVVPESAVSSVKSRKVDATSGPGAATVAVMQGYEEWQASGLAVGTSRAQRSAFGKWTKFQDARLGECSDPDYYMEREDEKAS